MKILVLTACGGKKRQEAMPAYKLYKSARIKAVYNRRCGHDMGILSSRYGMVNAHEIIEPYERVLDENRVVEMIPQVTEKIRDYDCVVFFKGGARGIYLTCIAKACEKAGKSLVTFGFANMGGINDLPKILRILNRSSHESEREIEHLDDRFVHLEVYRPH